MPRRPSGRGPSGASMGNQGPRRMEGSGRPTRGGRGTVAGSRNGGPVGVSPVFGGPSGRPRGVSRPTMGRRRRPQQPRAQGPPWSARPPDGVDSTRAIGWDRPWWMGGTGAGEPHEVAGLRGGGVAWRKAMHPLGGGSAERPLRDPGASLAARTPEGSRSPRSNSGQSHGPALLTGEPSERIYQAGPGGVH